MLYLIYNYYVFQGWFNETTSILKMEKEIEQVKNEFDTNAVKIFFSIYEKFETDVKQLNRRRDENVFQQIQGKYVFTLKNQLENLAKEMLNKHHQLKLIHHLSRTLTDSISFYLHEFIQKSGSL